MVNEIAKTIEPELEKFNQYFKDVLKSKVALLDLIIKYMTKKKGKQVRPMLVLLCAKLCGSINERSFIGAAMVELLHSATLIHDDVVDEASERRGIATINAAWNNKIAVLIGDFLLGKGLLTSIDANEFGFLKATASAVKRMSEGELLQIQKSRDVNLDEETYFRIISDKTASLLATCCEIGALSASDDPKVHDIMRNYGENIGIAFQIRDDIFDYLGSSKVIGKPVGNDLKEKKITLPLLHSFSKVTKKKSKEILKLVKKDKITRKEINYIISFVKENGGIDYSEKKAFEYSQKAKDLIKDFPDSDVKKSLMIFADYVVERTK